MKKTNLKFNFKNEMDVESNLNCIDNMKNNYLFKVNFKDGKSKTAKEISKIILNDEYIKFNEQYKTSSITFKDKDNFNKIYIDNIESIEVYTK